ncbi:MAG TPA: hypothetical protein DD438_02890 [Verrucomicrobiales bacterium]|nr:hypothetical protein [Verrucomicrobiales bacterium]
MSISPASLIKSRETRAAHSLREEVPVFFRWRADIGWLQIGKDKRKYVRIYRHDGKTEMDDRLKFKFGVGPQVLYLDQVECTRR